jgi:hypothetical protein
MGGGKVDVSCKEEEENNVHDELLNALEENSVCAPLGEAYVNGQKVDWVDMKKVIAVRVITNGEGKCTATETRP